MSDNQTVNQEPEDESSSTSSGTYQSEADPQEGSSSTSGTNQSEADPQEGSSTKKRRIGEESKHQLLPTEHRVPAAMSITTPTSGLSIASASGMSIASASGMSIASASGMSIASASGLSIASASGIPTTVSAPVQAHNAAQMILYEAAFQAGGLPSFIEAIVSAIKASLDPRFSALEVQMKGHEDRMKGLEHNVKGLQDNVKGLRDNVKGLQDNVKGLQDNVKTLQASSDEWKIGILQHNTVSSSSDEAVNDLKIVETIIEKGTARDVFGRFSHPLGIAENRSGERHLLMRASIKKRILIRLPGATIGRIISTFLPKEVAEVPRSDSASIQIKPAPTSSVLIEMAPTLETHVLDFGYLADMSIDSV